MCEECRQYPCHPRCPNYEDKPLKECYECGLYMYEGDIGYYIDGEYFCEDCAIDWLEQFKTTL